MAAGRPTRLQRALGLALARRALRGYLTAAGRQGLAALAATVSSPPR